MSARVKIFVDHRGRVSNPIIRSDLLDWEFVGLAKIKSGQIYDVIRDLSEEMDRRTGVPPLLMGRVSKEKTY